MSQPALQTARRANDHAIPTAQPALTRCAIYVRKSTEEGLEQAFNSLDAQRLACEEYVRTRAAEGWTILSDQYTDGGWSGATIHRPAFQRLLGDVKAGKIDCVICHRLDRLSRSLLDFAQLMKFFEDHGVAFVSITQQFDSSDPVGRLTLHLLATFAEFERSLIVQRTKDKVAASRRRGRWTGGTMVKGYDLRESRLVINPDEADQVRQIFGLYLRELSLTAVVRELNLRGWTTKSWTRKDGSKREGRPFDKPSLLRLLRNPLYAGKIRCNGSLADGEHDAIVNEGTWQRAQAHLTHNGTAGYQGERAAHDALLRGLLRCGACGSGMSPTYTVKGDRRYRYYVCQSVAKKGAHACPCGRVAAHKVEERVIEQIRTIAKDPWLVAETVRQAKGQLDQHRKALEAEQRQLGKDLKRERASLRRLANGRSRNGDASGITARLAGIQERIETVERRLVTVAQDLDSAKQQVIDERQVAAALSAFDSVWQALIPTEQARILGLLTEGITYDGRTQKLELAFRPGGIGRLHEFQAS